MAAIEISKSAEKYLKELLQKQDSDAVGIKVFVSEPGSPRAETCIAYCKEDDDITEYELFTDYSFSLYQEKKSLTFLEKAVVDYSPDKFGGTLTIKAPNAKVPSIGQDASLEERVNYLLYSEINPSLAAHGGEVSLVEILNKETAVLQFGGGCQGCGMVDVTLKQGVEVMMKESVPDIVAIHDATDHDSGSNPYYR